MVHHVAAHGWPRSSKKTRHLCFLFDMNIAAAKSMYTRPKSIGQKYLDRVTMNGHAYTSSGFLKPCVCIRWVQPSAYWLTRTKKMQVRSTTHINYILNRVKPSCKYQHPVSWSFDPDAARLRLRGASSGSTSHVQSRFPSLAFYNRLSSYSRLKIPLNDHLGPSWSVCTTWQNLDLLC